MLVAKSAVESDGNCTLMAMPPPIGRSPDLTRAVPAGPRCVDLGCGRRRQPGAIGVDLVPLPGVDVVAHLEAAHLPFGDATLDTVLAFNVLEHLDDLPRVMQEIARVLRPGGRCVAEVPYFASPGAFADPTHRRAFTYTTFEHFTPPPACGWQANRHTWFGEAPFWVRRRRLVFGRLHRLLGLAWLANRLPGLYENFFVYWFPARALEVELVRRSAAT